MKVVVFGGTTEGRVLAQAVAESRIKLHVCVATAYGASLLPSDKNIIIHQGRMDEQEMERFLKKIMPSCCLDATHPYADVVTENVCRTCGRLAIPYFRVYRQQEDAEDVRFVKSVEEAAEFLKGVSGNIFLATGSKELEKYTVIPDYQSRCTVRVLPTVEALTKCSTLGFWGKHLIAMQGPFSEELNYGMLKQSSSQWMVTKNSGKEGGFSEKCEAALRAGARLIVVERPKETEEEPGRIKKMTLPEAVRFLSSLAETIPEKRRKIWLISAGPGNPDLLTKRACQLIRESDVLIGSERMLASCGAVVKEAEKKPVFQSYRKKEIADFIKNHVEYQKIAVLYSGDIGLYSGAKGMRALLKAYEVEEVSGVSSVSYFLNRLGVPRERTVVISMHGQQENVISLLREHEKVCVLLGESGQIARISRELLALDMKKVTITVGERLSYNEERITSGSPADFQTQEFDALSVALFENPKARKPVVCAGIPDESFLRGKVPMTKEEIRILSVSKLKLTEDSILYDVGAGTGSLSVEAARLCKKGRIYAIEKNPQAIELICQNRRQFQVENLEVVEGTAPACLENLPAPTHAFIGGSSGKLAEIIDRIMKKNPKARFVINAVTLETISEIERLAEKYSDVRKPEIVQVNVAKGKKLGKYHFMEAENPVMIVAF